MDFFAKSWVPWLSFRWRQVEGLSDFKIQHAATLLTFLMAMIRLYFYDCLGDFFNDIFKGTSERGFASLERPQMSHQTTQELP